MPGTLRYEQREARIETQLKRTVGYDGVACRADLVKTGALSREDDRLIERRRHAVFEINLYATEAEQLDWIERANRTLREAPARFLLRRGSIVLVHRAPPRTTRWLAAVIMADGPHAQSIARGRDERPAIERLFDPAKNAAVSGTLRTIYPGRVRPPLPGGRWYFRNYGAERSNRGLAVLEALRRGQALTKSYQRDAAEGQRNAQQFWWEHGFIERGGAPASANRAG